MKVETKDRDGNALVCFVRKPTSKDNQEAKLYGNSVAAKILLRKDSDGKPNFITRNQVRQLLKDSGRLSDEDEHKIVELSGKIKILSNKLIEGGIKKTEGRKIAIELRDLRNELFLALLNINELDEHTLENEIENATFDCLVSLCATKENGDRLFNSVDDYLKADDEPYAFDVAQKLKVILYGTNEDMVRDNIENKFLAKYGYIDEKLRLVNKDGKLVDKDFNLINEDGERVDEAGEVLEKHQKIELGEFLDEEDEKHIESVQQDVVDKQE